MSRLALRLFGTPRLELDGLPVDLERRKALALVAYAVMTHQSHSRESLAALLWPDTPPGRAYANLRHCLWEINQALGEGWLVADRDHVSLKPGADTGANTG